LRKNLDSFVLDRLHKLLQRSFYRRDKLGVGLTNLQERLGIDHRAGDVGLVGGIDTKGLRETSISFGDFTFACAFRCGGM